jgi:hypothetical protein
VAPAPSRHTLTLPVDGEYQGRGRSIRGFGRPARTPAAAGRTKSEGTKPAEASPGLGFERAAPDGRRSYRNKTIFFVSFHSPAVRR